MNSVYNKFNYEIFKMPKSILIKKILLLFIGITFISFAVAFNKCAGLGNDPISVLFDGLRNFIYNLTGYNSLGLATNIMNISLLIVLLFVGRNYVNIGTLMYALPMGSLISVGFYVYKILGINSDVLGWRIFSSVIGCFMLFLGIAIFIAVDIGLDPWAGITVYISNKLNKPYKVIKIVLDVICFLVGYLLGGVVGIVTIVAAIIGGPAINAMSMFISKRILHENA